MSQPLIAFVDVDDTLVHTVGAKRIPIPRMLARIRELYQEGAVLYLWSSGGAEYARESAEELGLVDCFVGFLPKPNLLIDDQRYPSGNILGTKDPCRCRSGNLTNALG